MPHLYDDAHTSMPPDARRPAAQERPRPQLGSHALQSPRGAPASLIAFLKMRKRKSNDFQAAAVPPWRFPISFLKGQAAGQPPVLIRASRLLSNPRRGPRCKLSRASDSSQPGFAMSSPALCLAALGEGGAVGIEERGFRSAHCSSRDPRAHDHSILAPVLRVKSCARDRQLLLQCFLPRVCAVGHVLLRLFHSNLLHRPSERELPSAHATPLIIHHIRL